ncbi:hypothetical protein CUMW_264520 [Citrus unshiu]|uniref:Uncharacterized protein n=1 Tax=Citrus unshiu TaxID=55188 RepID=A0A2H5QV31_CITUN|nr:hypothetical protein CUMW_264520 [Citrus unshiu]
MSRYDTEEEAPSRHPLLSLMKIHGTQFKWVGFPLLTEMAPKIGSTVMLIIEQVSLLARGTALVLNIAHHIGQ